MANNANLSYYQRNKELIDRLNKDTKTDYVHKQEKDIPTCLKKTRKKDLSTTKIDVKT